MNPAFPAAASALMVLVAATLAAPRSTVRQLAPTTTEGTERATVGPLAKLGGALRRRLGADPDPVRDRRMGWLVLASVVGLALSPLIPVLVVVVVGANSVRRRRRDEQRRQRGLIDELPDVVDLLSLAISAGYNVALAVDVVAEHGSGSVAAEFDRVRERSAAGAPLAHELESIPARLGESVRPLTRVLTQALHDGAPLGPALEQLAVDVRAQRRRGAEERARRVSVRLLFPLVFCVLPAFAFLTVIPLLISTLRDLSL